MGLDMLIVEPLIEVPAPTQKQLFRPPCPLLNFG